MNILAPLPARLAVEIVFDFVCPWCYLGVQRLAFLLARRQDLAIERIWRPFLLNPDMPRAGMSRADYMIRKFGAEDRARRLYSSIAEIGAAEGIAFNFPGIRRTPNSVDAHRLVRYAAGLGAADQLVDAIFRAHFVDGGDIGNPALLVGLAAGQGLDPQAVEEFLVPCFLIESEHAIAGAQETEVLERLIDLAACMPR
jgi:predicted DsbA family dithiol-disulfide isomerase